MYPAKVLDLLKAQSLYYDDFEEYSINRIETAGLPSEPPRKKRKVKKITFKGR